jgi:hypothetical protein
MLEDDLLEQRMELLAQSIKRMKEKGRKKKSKKLSSPKHPNNGNDISYDDPNEVSLTSEADAEYLNDLNYDTPTEDYSDDTEEE